MVVQRKLISQRNDITSNCGTHSYYDEIKNPMDFGTMKTKLDQGLYSTMDEFANDVHLVLANCRKFNPPTTDPTICADIVEKLFRKEWAKAMEKKLSFQEKRSIQAVMNKLAHEIEWVPCVFGCGELYH